MSEHLFHITEATGWAGAQAVGGYTAPSLATEGFIHLSTREQVLRTAERFYRGIAGLVLLEIDPDRLTANVEWEPADGDVFPHLYGPLALGAVLAAHAFPPSPDGTFEMPAGC